MDKDLKNPEFVHRVKWLIDTRYGGVPARLSESSGVSKAGLSKILNEGTRPFASTIDKLVSGTGCSRRWLVAGIGDAFPDTTRPPSQPDTLFPPGDRTQQQCRFIEIYAHVCALSGALTASMEPVRLARGIAVAARAAIPDGRLDFTELENAIVAIETVLERRALSLCPEQRAVMALSCYRLHGLAGRASFDDVLDVLLEDHAH